MRSEPTTLLPDRRAPAPRGFTTIELLTVMGIIALLAGILVIGFRGVSTGSQNSQTKTILERMRSMTAVVFNNKSAGTKFFQAQIPAIYGAAPAWDFVPADAPQDLLLFRTAQVLKVLNGMPEAKSIFDELPTERKVLMHFNETTGARVAAAGVGVLSVSMPLDAWADPADPRPLIFVFDNWQVPQTSGRSTLRQLTGGGETGGLTNLYSDSAKGSYAATGANTLGSALRSPDRMPFWASAGPDRQYGTHDDNVYSFEN